MPYTIDDATFRHKLGLHETNVSHTARYLERGVDNFVLPGWVTPSGYRLVKSKQGEQYRLISNETQETVYAVKLIFRTDIIAKQKTCTQVMVWRSPDARHETAVYNLPKFFFAYFLKSYVIIVTDEQQTPEGQSFWERRISQALIDGSYVYVSDGGEMDRPLYPVEDWDTFYKKWITFCWGKDPEVHTHRLVVISIEPLL